MSLRWDKHFLQLALDHARMSKDPSTKVGAIITGPDREIRSAGFNGFPRYVIDSPERLNNRELKYRLVVHAELNAILAAARIGTPLNGCIMYISAMSAEGTIFGGPPCNRCLVELIQSGIREVVTDKQNYAGTRWLQDCPDLSRQLMVEAGIRFREIA